MDKKRKVYKKAHSNPMETVLLSEMSDFSKDDSGQYIYCKFDSMGVELYRGNNTIIVKDLINGTSTDFVYKDDADIDGITRFIKLCVPRHLKNRSPLIRLLRDIEYYGTIYMFGLYDKIKVSKDYKEVVVNGVNVSITEDLVDSISKLRDSINSLVAGLDVVIKKVIELLVPDEVSDWYGWYISTTLKSVLFSLLLYGKYTGNEKVLTYRGLDFVRDDLESFVLDLRDACICAVDRDLDLIIQRELTQ